jgi:hypothetical protein
MVAATSIEEVRKKIEPYAKAGATRIIIPYVPCSTEPVAEFARFLQAW